MTEATEGANGKQLAGLYAEEARLTEQIVKLAKRRRAARAALRAFVPGFEGTGARGGGVSEESHRVTAALVKALEEHGPATVAELHVALVDQHGIQVSPSKSQSVQRTNIYTLLVRNPRLFKKARGKWARR